MHQIFPTVNQVFSYHLKNFEVINRLMDSVSLRVDAQEQYEKAINKSALNISSLESDHPLYSKIIKSFKSLINERAHQIRYFKMQLAKEAEVLKEALLPLQDKMRTYLSELKNMEKDLKTSFDTILKHRSSSEQKLRQLDEKFILNEVAVLYKQNKGLRKHSQSYLAEQEKMMKSLQKDWEAVRCGMTNFEGGAQEYEKKIWELDVRVQQEFVDFFKKVNVHQISLIRNIQYDIDTMIKKTDIFNWQNTNEFKDQFSNKAIQQLELSFSDPFINFKRAIVFQENLIDPKSDLNPDHQKLQILISKLRQKKENEVFLSSLKKNYPQFRDEICEWIQSFRKAGEFKFQFQDFHLIVSSFRQILKCALTYLDFECVQKIIMYGNSYFHQDSSQKKTTILNEIQKEKMLSDLTFWKFYMLWTIRNYISTCTVTEEKDIYIRNGVYSTLLGCALNMIDFGIQKHSTKNLIGKIGKTFASLTQTQIAELLKVIETVYQKNQKMKKSKKG